MGTDVLVRRPLDDIFVQRPPNFIMDFGSKACHQCESNATNCLSASVNKVKMNSGVMLLKPHTFVFENLLESLRTAVNCEQGEQAVIQSVVNEILSQTGRATWRVGCFSQTWNCKMESFPNMPKMHLKMNPCWCHVQEDGPHIAHFSGNSKPWRELWDETTQKPVEHISRILARTVELWWKCWRSAQKVAAAVQSGAGPEVGKRMMMMSKQA